MTLSYPTLIALILVLSITKTIQQPVINQPSITNQQVLTPFFQQPFNLPFLSRPLVSQPLFRAPTFSELIAGQAAASGGQAARAPQFFDLFARQQEANQAAASQGARAPQFFDLFVNQAVANQAAANQAATNQAAANQAAANQAASINAANAANQAAASQAGSSGAAAEPIGFNAYCTTCFNNLFGIATTQPPPVTTNIPDTLTTKNIFQKAGWETDDKGNVFVGSDDSKLLLISVGSYWPFPKDYRRRRR